MSVIGTRPGAGEPRPDGWPAIVFAPFRLDLRGAQLLRGSQPIPLRPKTFGVLRFLAEHPGELITKDALLDALWHGVAVTPDTLNKSIGELRVALGDDSHAPRFIETVHRRGFRFIAPTEQSDGEPRQPAIRPAPDTRATGRDRPFVGRRDELAELDAAFARAHHGQRQMVFVTGPAGVGKSSLVDVFLDSLPVHDTIWIGRADCFEHHGPREAYLPVLEALQRLAGLPQAAPLVQAMRRTAPLWLAQMPWLIDDGERDGLQRALVGVRPERMPRELAALLEALTAELTVVLVVEDLHWSDPSTVDLLSSLAQRREPARLLVVGTYRPAELAVHEHALAGAVRTLKVQRRCTTVGLDDLDHDAVGAYLEKRFPGSDFPTEITRLLHDHTGGHPLFLAGIVDDLVSRGWFLETQPGWAVSRPPALLDLGVPDDVRLMIETQLQRLSPPERRLLEAASVAGNQITAPLLAAMLGSDAADVERGCEGLMRAQHFLRRAGSAAWPDGSTVRRYAFTHELYEKVVYEDVPNDRRARLHQRVGEALEDAYGERATEIAGQLATHFERGGDVRRAVRYLGAAAARVRRIGASREAVGYLEPALALVARLPDAGERHRVELELRLGVGRALGDVHGFAAEAVRANYERASELCTRIGSLAELIEALHARWYVHAILAERDEALALARELAEVAERLASPDAGILADSVLVRTATYDARFTDAVAHMDSLLGRVGTAGVRRGAHAYGANPVTAALMHTAIARWFLGEPVVARAIAADGVARVRATGDRFSLSAALMQAALVHLLCREAAVGEALALEGMEIAADHGFAFWRAINSAMCGWARVQHGDLDAGCEALTRAFEAMQATRSRFFLGFVHGFLAECHLRSGAVAAGLEHAEAGVLASTTLDRPYGPELWRLKGELLLAARGGGRDDDAERCLVRALESSRANAARSLELRAATSLSRLWHTTRRTAKARLLLTDVCERFPDDLDTPDLRAARALRADVLPRR